ncbi:NAD(P)-binding protein [Domibacillus sp.]|nr:NAD(P)-binding protein [Domibacillus sp.]
MKKAIMIGAGIGGLAAAVTLQSRGIHTTVFDENRTQAAK